MQLIWGSSLICLMHLFALCRMSYSELRDRDSMIGMKEESDTPGTGLNFLVLGDWGGLPYSPYRTDVEKAVSKAMGTVAENINAQFIVALGKPQKSH